PRSGLTQWLCQPALEEPQAEGGNGECQGRDAPEPQKPERCLQPGRLHHADREAITQDPGQGDCGYPCHQTSRRSLSYPHKSVGGRPVWVADTGVNGGRGRCPPPPLPHLRTSGAVIRKSRAGATPRGGCRRGKEWAATRRPAVALPPSPPTAGPV